MILGEKILTLRKKSGWSQEELADKMNVSRQSISKWEGSASIPDINKIIEMSKLFGVSTDYLLKDDMESAEYTADETDLRRRILLDEAVSYIDVMKKYAKQLSIGVMMCILAPVALIILLGVSETKTSGINISENLAAGIGLMALFCIVASAVAIFIISSTRLKKYEYIKNGDFELEYGVSGIVQEKQGSFSDRYITNIVIGVVLCILAPCPLIVAGLAGASDMVCLLLTALLLIIVSFAVVLFVYSATRKESFDKLLFEGEYSLKYKEKNQKFDRFSGIYWPAVVMIYLAWSFISKDWNISWIIWPISALLFASLSAAFKRD